MREIQRNAGAHPITLSTPLLTNVWSRTRVTASHEVLLLVGAACAGSARAGFATSRLEPTFGSSCGSAAGRFERGRRCDADRSLRRGRQPHADLRKFHDQSKGSAA